MHDHCHRHLVTVQSADWTTLRTAKRSRMGDILTLSWVKSLFLPPAGRGEVVSPRCVSMFHRCRTSNVKMTTISSPCCCCCLHSLRLHNRYFPVCIHAYVIAYCSIKFFITYSKFNYLCISSIRLILRGAVASGLIVDVAGSG